MSLQHVTIVEQQKKKRTWKTKMTIIDRVEKVFGRVAGAKVLSCAPKVQTEQLELHAED